MNDIRVFQNEEFGIIRAVEIDGEAWFVFGDICEMFGVENRRTILSKLEDDEKGVSQIATPGGPQNMTVVNEAGLYAALFAMQPQKSRAEGEDARREIEKRQERLRNFKRWVTHIVLPSIRKTGGYIAGEEQLDEDELVARALIVVNEKLKQREAENMRLRGENSRLSAENAIAAPKAEYFDQLVDRNLLTGIRETAKELGVKEKTFVGFLLDKKYLYRDKKGRLMPMADKNDGLFEVKESINEKTNWAGTQTMITPKGRETFRLLTQGL